MIIHSIVPFEKMFESPPQAPAEYIPIRGGLVALDSSGGKRRVARVISTDPTVYLDQTLLPGNEYPPPGMIRK